MRSPCLALLLGAAIIQCSLMLVKASLLLQLRGGIGPQPAQNDADYYSQFELDYGTDDKERLAGSLRGCHFLPNALLGEYARSSPDPFIRWVYEHLEKGPEPFGDRIKPFYAADFGTRASLKKGENPKIYIVSRKLKRDSQGFLDSPPEEVDIEVREIWQPWLKNKCNFALRYIVPNRVNIIKIMEAKGKFISVAKVEEDDARSRTMVEMTFKSSLLDRLRGKRNVVIKHEIDSVAKSGFPSIESLKSMVEKKVKKQ